MPSPAQTFEIDYMTGKETLMNTSTRPSQQRSDACRPVRKASLVAGVALLLMSALAGFGYDFAISRLVTAGNAALTARHIMAHEGLFRFGIASLFLVVALDVVVAWGLYRVFSPVSKRISALAAWLRAVYAGIFAVAVVQLAGALRLLGNDRSLPASGAARAHAAALSDITRFTDIWHAGLILFGLHLLLISWLAYRSGYVPKLLGVLIAIAGLGYIADSIGRLVSHGWTDVSTVTFIGEFLLALWLVIRGRRITLSQPAIGAKLTGAAR
jgi:hypothetical protein